VRVPLEYQFMIPLVGVAMLSLAAVGYIYGQIATQHTRNRIEDQIQGVAGVLTNSNFPLTDSVLQQMKGLSNAEFVLLDGSENVVSSSMVEHLLQLPTGQRVASSDKLSLGVPVSIGGRQYFHSSIELSQRPVARNGRVLHVLFPLNQYQAAWRAAFVPPLLVGTVAVVGVALVTHWLARRFSRTLALVGERVLQLAGGDYQTVPPPVRDDELRDLVLAINQAASRLQEYELQVRRTEQMRTVALLGAGMAHELRNAATGCRLAVDLHAEHCQAVESDESLTVARNQLQLMESRLQRFLRLGRTSADSVQEICEVGHLVDELIPLVMPATRHAGVELTWRKPPEEFLIKADPEALTLSIMNLVLNAVEAASQASKKSRQSEARVGILLQNAKEDQMKVIVADTGSGLEHDLAQQLYEPFVSGKQQGIGLGLAVVKQVAESHGGCISWQRKQGVTQFILSLPLIGRKLVGSMPNNGKIISSR